MVFVFISYFSHSEGPKFKYLRLLDELTKEVPIFVPSSFLMPKYSLRNPVLKRLQDERPNFLPLN
jgi:hypothetical protein